MYIWTKSKRKYGGMVSDDDDGMSAKKKKEMESARQNEQKRNKVDGFSHHRHRQTRVQYRKQPTMADEEGARSVHRSHFSCHCRRCLQRRNKNIQCFLLFNLIAFYI